MRRIVGLAMMIDGVSQALGVSGLISTLADRSLRDQTLFAAHVIVGAGLLFAGRSIFSGSSSNAGPTWNPTLNPFEAGTIQRRSAAPSIGLPIFLLIAALALSVAEMAFFNWTDTALRAIYTAAAAALLLRTSKTALPIA